MSWTMVFIFFAGGWLAGFVLVVWLARRKAAVLRSNIADLTVLAGTAEKGWRRPEADSTLGFRGWKWDRSAADRPDVPKCLRSPVQGTPWPDAELRVSDWDRGDAVRGAAGIHAIWPVPSKWQDTEVPAFLGLPVVGIVERWGHYVLGEDGWRAEWVVIKELAAVPSIIEEVRKAYPGITVHERKVQSPVESPMVITGVLGPFGLSPGSLGNSTQVGLDKALDNGTDHA